LGRVILEGDVGGIRKALAGGAAVNGKGSHGLTPLHLSLLSFQIESFRTLLSEGANPNLSADNGDAVMSLAALMPEPSWLELAIDRGGDADFPDRRGRTPLMIAARHGRVENVRLLVSKGASLNAIDRHGETALIHTFQAFKPSLAIARLLIAAGADPEKANVAGFKARDFAETYGDAGFLTVFPSP
ncbi:MAG: ankyrin repeat domain-containing protein, partial [Verrucomicrobiae bacterium]|nr:ankyrin repeat domain-containing protein [Verrucomicrobiae bacterium]